MSLLSAVIITYNEEKNIGRCLESIKDLADEIIVVDSNSADNTEKICKNYPVHFIKHEFEGYIEQKRYALKLANNDFVLSLDADEALSEELQQSIMNIKTNFECDGYSMNRLTKYCGKWIRHCNWYPDRKLRLFNKAKGNWSGENPHDKVMLKSGSKTCHLKGDILHYSYYTLDDHYKQIENFTTISSKTLFEKGRKSTFIKLYLAPVAKFIRDYFFNLGFLDGKAGFTICWLSAGATYKKYKKLKLFTKKYANAN